MRFHLDVLPDARLHVDTSAKHRTISVPDHHPGTIEAHDLVFAIAVSIGLAHFEWVFHTASIAIQIPTRLLSSIPQDRNADTGELRALLLVQQKTARVQSPGGQSY
jgi:hypothetical protein